jgi:hypothetical protein
MPKTKAAEKPEEDTIFDLNIPDTTISGIVSRRADEAQKHWEKEYNLTKTRENNKKLYNSSYIKDSIRDDRYEKVFSDNNIFKAVRTVLPFVTSRITQPEVVPSGEKDLNIQFAKDFEKILVEVADENYAKDKIKLAVQDLLTGARVGILKWVHSGDKVTLEHLTPDSVVIGKRSRLREEPDFIRHKQKRTVGELVRQFPHKKEVIYKLYNVTKGVPSQLEKEVEITENWIFVEEEEKTCLAIVWLTTDKNIVLGKMKDPNWNDEGENIIDEHMSPFIFFNFLNDGSGYIDETSFVEFAEYNQKTIRYARLYHCGERGVCRYWCSGVR